MRARNDPYWIVFSSSLAVKALKEWIYFQPFNNFVFEILCFFRCNLNSFGNMKRYLRLLILKAVGIIFLKHSLDQWFEIKMQEKIQIKKNIFCKLGSELQICSRVTSKQKVFFLQLHFLRHFFSLNHLFRECFRTWRECRVYYNWG